jgi:hypothetical protein
MNAGFSSGVLRWLASGFTRLADRLDAPSHYAEPLTPKCVPTQPDEYVFELRNRLSRYY